MNAFDEAERAADEDGLEVEKDAVELLFDDEKLDGVNGVEVDDNVLEDE